MEVGEVGEVLEHLVDVALGLDREPQQDHLYINISITERYLFKEPIEKKNLMVLNYYYRKF